MGRTSTYSEPPNINLPSDLGVRQDDRAMFNIQGAPPQPLATLSDDDSADWLHLSCARFDDAPERRPHFAVVELLRTEMPPPLGEEPT